MIPLFVVYLAGCAVMLAAGLVEQRRHLRHLYAIPTRVVVNGIRGKSSITRLAAGALRGGGQRTVAKTTGTAARFITPNGLEEPLHRKFGLANIVEQITTVRRAAAYRPDSLVMECMAVMPDLQEVNERKLLRSTVCVICNVREDHLVEMGPTLDDVARSLARSMPAGGVCVTAETDRAHILREEAERRDCALIEVDPDSVSDSEIQRFTSITFKDNVAVAVAVAELCGIERQAALDGMVAAAPDPGTVSVNRYAAGEDRHVLFANVFAANDPESTLQNIDLLTERGLLHDPLNVVINCRTDRVERNTQMGELTGRLSPERVILIGEQTRAARVGVPDDLADRVVDLGGKLPFEQLLDTLVTDSSGTSSLTAIGNIHGQGEILLEHMHALPVQQAPANTEWAMQQADVTSPVMRPVATSTWPAHSGTLPPLPPDTGTWFGSPPLPQRHTPGHAHARNQYDNRTNHAGRRAP